jgi:ferritin-like metal-binding protein YciE
MRPHLALGKLDATKTFLEKDVSKQQLVKAAFITDSYEAACYQELIEPLKQIGRYDLVRGIKSAVRTFRMKVTAKQIDKVFLNGSVLNFANRVRGFA